MTLDSHTHTMRNKTAKLCRIQRISRLQQNGGLLICCDKLNKKSKARVRRFVLHNVNDNIRTIMLLISHRKCILIYAIYLMVIANTWINNHFARAERQYTNNNRKLCFSHLFTIFIPKPIDCRRLLLVRRFQECINEWQFNAQQRIKYVNINAALLSLLFLCFGMQNDVRRFCMSAQATKASQPATKWSTKWSEWQQIDQLVWMLRMRNRLICDADDPSKYCNDHSERCVVVVVVVFFLYVNLVICQQLVACALRQQVVNSMMRLINHLFGWLLHARFMFSFLRFGFLLHPRATTRAHSFPFQFQFNQQFLPVE